jgi:radical SAM superfamily enzyme YgiQ (UPF0313 family)
MRIALVRPNIGRLEHSLFVDEARMEPLELAVLAGLTPREHEVVLRDDRVEEIRYDESFDLVAVTVQTFTARRAYEIADAFRARGIRVVIGGMHAALAPSEAGVHADAVVTGDAEAVWEEVVADAAAERLKPCYHAAVGAAHPNSIPRRDIYGRRRYLPVTLLQFGRGCTSRCDFCATGAYAGGAFHTRRIDRVLAEIASQGRRYLFFVDDNIVADPAAAKELFREIEPLKVRWVSQASVDMTGDRELMEWMARSGCLGHVIGFESLNSANLESVGKTVNYSGARDHYREEIRVLREYGLQTWAAFTLGYDYDTVDSVKQTLEFALENRFAFAAFNILMPYPGIPFYTHLARQRRLLFDGVWWLHPEYRFNHAAFIPSLMSPQQLTDAGLQCRARFNSVASILRRALDPRTNMRSILKLGIYAVYAPLFRRETFKKQGMRLGLHHED